MMTSFMSQFRLLFHNILNTIILTFYVIIMTYHNFYFLSLFDLPIMIYQSKAYIWLLYDSIIHLFHLMIKLLQCSPTMNSSKASHQFTFRLPDSDVTLNDTFVNYSHHTLSACERKRESLVCSESSDGVSVWSDFEVIHPGLVAAVTT